MRLLVCECPNRVNRHRVEPAASPAMSARPGKRKRSFEGTTQEVLAADNISSLGRQTVPPCYWAFGSTLLGDVQTSQHPAEAVIT